MAVEDWLSDLSPHSLSTVTSAVADPSIAHSPAGTLFQFERVAYFVTDPDSDTASGRLVLNRTVNLKESKPRLGTTAPAAAAPRGGNKK